MKKRIVTLIVFLLTACMMLSGCSSDGSKPTVQPGDVVSEEPTSSTEQEGHLYTYEVEGATIPLHTRVEDYITSDRVFRYFDLAKEQGWHSYWPEYEGNYEYPLLCYDNNAFVCYYMGSNKIAEQISYGEMSKKNPGLEGMFRSIFIDESVFDDGNEYFVNERNGYRMRFSQIVLITYLIENNKPEPDKYLLDKFFPFVDNRFILSD